MISEFVDIVKAKSSIALFHRGTGQLLVFDIVAESEILKLQSSPKESSSDLKLDEEVLSALRKYKMLQD